MRKTLAAAITLITLCTALAIPARLAAQEQQEHNNKLPHYGVIDLGTLGGTVSGALAINSKGWVTGFSSLPGCRFPLMRRLWCFHSVFTVNV